MAILGVLPSLIRQIEEEMLFRAYVSESLRLTPQNKYLTTAYSDLIKPRKRERGDPKQVAAEIIKKAGLTVL